MTTSTQAPWNTALPTARGPLSEVLIDALRREPGDIVFPTVEADPWGDDLQLALYTAYELHYQGFHRVDPAWEWDPELLRLRARMESTFLRAMRERVDGGADLSAELDALLVEPIPGEGISHFLRDEGEWWHMREYFAHRSLYHLKEADPHAWAIPRLRGRAKAALVAVEFDEFGGGRAEKMHAQLFADLLAGAGMSPDYLHYLDHVPACALAPVNLMSLFGLHRRWVGALVGHFTAAEITTGPSAARMAAALSKMDASAACSLFYTEHIEADAVHEQVMRHDVVGGLLEQRPELAADITFGVQTTNLVEQHLSEHLLGSWRAGHTSLRTPL